VAWTCRASCLAALLLAGQASALTDYWSNSPSSLEECSARRRPGEEVRYWHCYYLYAFEHMDQMQAVNARLERTLRRDPTLVYGALVHAALMDMLVGDQTPGITFYVPVQAEFRRRGDHLGELITVVATLWWASWNGEEEVGARQYARGLELAREMEDPDARAWVLESGADLAMGLLDYGRAERLVREAEATVTAGAPWWVQWRIRYTLGRVLAATGRPAESLQAFDRAALWVGDHIDTFRALTAQGRAEQAVRLASADLLPKAEAERRLEEALGLARAAHFSTFLTGGEMPLTMLRAAMRGPSEESVSALHVALERGEQIDQPFLINNALRLLSRFSAETDPGHPELARAWLDELLHRATESDNPRDLALADLARAHLDWRAGDGAALQRDAVATLDAVDRLRWQQPEGLARARTSAEWSFVYELLSGWTLDLAGPAPARAPVEQALSTMERLRGRILLDELTRSGVAPEAVPPELEVSRRKAMSELAHAQRGLLAEKPGSPDRARVEAQVQSREAALAELEDAIARTHPASVPVPVASLQALQEALGEDEALLSFQLWRPELSLTAPYPQGRSWLVAIGHRDAFAVPVPDAHRLEEPLGMFYALLRRQQAGPSDPGEQLGQRLLGPALQRLGSAIHTLIIVPDGPLASVPLETLSLQGHPLADRYAFATAPSASLWLRWRSAGRGGSGPALALADPQGDAAPGLQRDAARWLEGLQLPSLPHARSEASAMVEALGRGGLLRVGPEASEHFLKTHDLRPWSVLHFATHAVVDETAPERSALVLAPGDPGEDGLLQPREIAQLDLAGKVVLLSACRTASGHLLEGEGAFGLVRAFFRAGAQAVVASPWPLGDLEARDLIQELAARLGEGESLNAALAEAKRARRNAGAPVTAWAGLQLYGDGSVVPSPARPRWRLALLATLLAAVAAGLLAAVRRGRARQLA
jgi:CHAT domain-containing protein